MGFVSEKRGGLASKLSRSRKASILHEIYFFTFQIFMVIIVFLAMMQYVNDVASGIGFQKRFTSMDMGLLTTAVFFAPGTMTHAYNPVFFPVPVDVIFADNIVNIKESGKDLDKLYWFLSDTNLVPLTDSKQLTPPELGSINPDSLVDMPKMMFDAAREAALRYNISYFKTGGKVSLYPEKVNPLQLVCPVLNTTDGDRRSGKVFVSGVLPGKEDYSNLSIPTNRLVQVLSRQDDLFTSSSVSDDGGSAVTAIPSGSELVMIIGDSGEEREPRSLVAYIPAEQNTLKARKLACLLINDILTPETAVFYAQIVPVFTGSLDEGSPLNVFREFSSEDQVMVFLDISSFDAGEVDVANTAEAIRRAVRRYYGDTNMTSVEGHTLGTPAGLQHIYSALLQGMPVGGRGFIDIWPVQTSLMRLTSCFGYRGCVNHRDGVCVGAPYASSRCGCAEWSGGKCVRWAEGRERGKCVDSIDCPKDGRKQFAECYGSLTHPGIDIGANRGTPVVAVADGVVVSKVFPNWGLVELDHGKGISSVYMHMDTVEVGVDDVVVKGQRIGTVGGRGVGSTEQQRANRYADHLHFEIRDKSLPKDMKDSEGNPVFVGNPETRRVNPLCYFHPELLGRLKPPENLACSDELCKNDPDCYPKTETAGHLKYCDYYPVVGEEAGRQEDGGVQDDG